MHLVLQGKDGSPTTAASLKKAADILQESFDPIIDLTTGRDLLPVMVYAQELGAWDYTGMYSVLLKHQVGTRCRPVCKALKPKSRTTPARSSVLLEH